MASFIELCLDKIIWLQGTNALRGENFHFWREIQIFDLLQSEYVWD